MKAYVGLYTARLEMPWVRSLKEKRALVKPAVEKLRSRFPLSVARIAGQDEWAWEVVGFSVIGHDGVWVETVLREAAHFLSAHAEFRVAAESWQVDEIALDGVLPLWSH